MKKGAFTCVPFTANGAFPTPLEDWCTRCDAPARVKNRHTDEEFKIFYFDDSQPLRVVVSEDGTRWNENDFRINHIPVRCHEE